MGVRVMRCFEYSVECDNCMNEEVYHTWDEHNKIRIHDMKTALKASGYKRRGGELLCPDCLTEYEKQARNNPW